MVWCSVIPGRGMPLSFVAAPSSRPTTGASEPFSNCTVRRRIMRILGRAQQHAPQVLIGSSGYYAIQLALEHGTVVASDVVNAACAARDNFANCTQALGWMDFLKVIPASEIWMIQGVETALFSGSLPWGCSPSRSGSSRDAENEVSRSRLVLRSMVRYVAAAHMQRSSHVSALLAPAASSIRFGSRRSVR